MDRKLKDEEKMLIFKIYILGLRALESNGNSKNKKNAQKGTELLPNVIKALDNG